MYERLHINPNNVMFFYSNYIPYRCNLLMVVIAKVFSANPKPVERKISRDYCTSFLGLPQKSPQTWWLQNNTDLSSHSSGGWKPQIKAPANLVSGERTLLASRLLPSHQVLTEHLLHAWALCSLLQGTNPMGAGSHPDDFI